MKLWGDLARGKVRKCLGALALLGLALGRARAANAELSASPKASKLLEGEESSFVLLGRQLAQLPIHTPSLVVVGPVRTDEGGGATVAPSALLQLHERIRLMVASAIPLAKHREIKPLLPQEARARARQDRVPLVYLTPRLRGGELLLEASVTAWPNSFWQVARKPEGTTTSHVSLRVQADSAIRSLFPATRGLLTKKTSSPSPLPSPLALACGDLDQDGADDVVVVGRREIVLGELVGDKFVSKRRRSWADLSPIASAPLRAPLGAAHVHQGSVIVGLSDRAHALQLDGRLAVTGYAPRVYPLSPTDCAPFSGTGIATTARACPPFPREKSPEATPSDAPSLDAWARGAVTRTDGTVASFEARLTPGGPALALTMNSPSTGRQEIPFGASGTALLWADLDGDGTIELLSSQATLEPNKDALRVHSVSEQGARLRASTAGGPVHALAVCPFLGKNPLPLIAAVGDELWVVR